MTNQEIRQGNNAIALTGEVKEHKLRLNEKDGKKYINGSMVIKTGEFSDIDLGIYVGEKSSKGTVKKSFITLQKFIDEEYKTGANITGEEVSTKVRIFGNGDFTPHFKEDMYKSEGSDEVKTIIKMDLGFGTISVDSRITPEDYKATFDVEVYVRNIIEEIKDDKTTGRAKIQGLLPVYGGKVIPLELIAGMVEDDDGETFDFGEQILNGVEIGCTINLWGAINYQSIIETVKKGGGLGKAKVEEKRTYINELLAEGADIAVEAKEFDAELVKKALIERDSRIEDKKNEAPKENKKSNGLGNSGSNAPKRNRPQF